MFNNLTQRFLKIIKKISNKGRLTEKNIKETLREIRIALLEADVALPVVKNFIPSIQKSVIGNQVNKSLTPGQELIKIVKKELTLILGKENHSLNLSVTPPAIILMIGLQGSGKTTTTAKLGQLIRTKYKKKVIVTSIDIYRLAAIKQLKMLSKQAKISFFPSNNTQSPKDIVQHAIQHAKLKFYDVLLIDTAGRLQIDKKMMNELLDVYNISHPIETFFVADAMFGQDSINVINEFNKYLPVSSFIITKTDSDTRAGIILSIKYLTKKPIKFIGTGEKLEELELFYPDRIASRILGMGDMLSLIENIENKIDKKHIKKFSNTIKKYNTFNFNDMLLHINQIKKIGGVNSILGKLPKTQTIFNSFQNNIDENILLKMKTIINSMTISERHQPELIKGSRKRRISLGSGIPIPEINQLLKQFNNIKKIMKTIKKGGVTKIMQGINNIIKNKF
ncbi:signal recognition particle protein [Buchnera aphidicola str. Bp (Baizongia pistaciae)]|uniref:Signal recognition particle protein n=1 Tax=Buchnera aphidicola subsp. Baizongia pistaciae (strain Bp) TaxID=224915 RepID=SRP54_BUCBP|nr:signal recognition particle protein [Buchnera aphidicola]Q89AE4.1 RecName: Full=Signal recognition particle protein; AltName: Full=Fifty-four homolog [Buchnera aphidicola str. Bp (Baizongia pistaciae)]AAO27075.1 signal recognition particle protein [Buchnera aphidicola str. Bp (Baizongia pistaciae)]